MKIQTRFSRCAAGAMLLLTAACAQDLTSRGAERAGELRLDLRPLQSQSQTGGSRSVLDRIVLEIEPTQAAAQRFELPVGLRQASLTLPVTVLEGEVGFRIEILSNNSTVLFAGETLVNVRQDGFSVTVPMTQRAPLLVVEPDTVVLVAVGGDFLVRSWGSNTQLPNLFWDLQRITPENDSCDQPPCLILGTRSGQLAAGAVHTLHFGRGGAPPGSSYTLRIDSQVGHVEVVVVVP